MAGIEVKSTGALLNGRAKGVIRSRLRSWLQGVLKTVRDDVREFAPRDTGAFRRSVVYRTRERGGATLEGEVFSTGPAVVTNTIENGRRAGAPMPPAGVLLPWMARHGIPAKAEYPIRRAIGRRGIAGRHPFARAFQRNKGLLAAQRRLLAAELVRGLNGR